VSTATTTAEDRRAARAEERRENILDAAQHVFTTKGYAETGIADIAAELGIGHGTIYRYFDNKHDVAVQVLDRAILAILSPLADEDPTASDTLDEYRAQTERIMHKMFETLEARPEAYSLLHIHALAIDPEATHRSFEVFSSRTEAFLRNGVEKGFLRQGMDIETTAQALVGLIFESTRRAVAEGTPSETLERWISAGVELMFSGVSA
jgi:AcrR family transcriptional regulator